VHLSSGFDNDHEYPRFINIHQLTQQQSYRELMFRNIQKEFSAHSIIKNEDYNKVSLHAILNV
jgi:hypothetical protein